MRIGIVVGEASGDILGAGLIRALRQHFPDAVFEGVGGPLMIAEGFNSLFEMDRLSVMGLIEPLKRLPELLRMRRQLIQYFSDHDTAVFIGIDSPDFNLTIEQKLKAKGLKTVHYVSPSVWAWRQKRIVKIKKSVDLMLCLLPFEAAFYRHHSVAVSFVGHPLADDIPLEDQTLVARERLSQQGVELAEDDIVLALLPGSRGGEVEALARVFLQTAQLCQQKIPKLVCLIPAANAARHAQLSTIIAQQDPRAKATVKLLDGQSHDVMAAANAVLMASGTTTLEALLLKKPMVVAYKMAPLSYRIISALLKTPYIALPNLLADRLLVPEILQNDVNPERLASELLTRLEYPKQYQGLQEDYRNIHLQLKQDASTRAADAIKALIKQSA